MTLRVPADVVRTAGQKNRQRVSEPTGFEKTTCILARAGKLMTEFWSGRDDHVVIWTGKARSLGAVWVFAFVRLFTLRGACSGSVVRDPWRPGRGLCGK